MADIKRIDIAEFRDLGFLQEVNRRLLHPAGLALEIVREEDGSAHLGGVWDYRDDPEGIVFGSLDDDDSRAKVAAVDEEIGRHAAAREALLGSTIQPVPACS